MSDLYPFRDDYISGAEIGRRLGFPLSAGFISNVLGVPPSFRTGMGNYWSPERTHHVYEALIRHIEDVQRKMPEDQP